MAIAALAAVVSAAPAAAQELPRFCPNRPDLGASGCTTEPGRVHVEWSALDWQRDDGDGDREDVLANEAALRIGVGPTTELQIGWTPVGTGQNTRQGDGRGSCRSRDGRRSAWGTPEPA